MFYLIVYIDFFCALLCVWCETGRCVCQNFLVYRNDTTLYVYGLDCFCYTTTPYIDPYTHIWLYTYRNINFVCLCLYVHACYADWNGENISFDLFIKKMAKIFISSDDGISKELLAFNLNNKYVYVNWTVYVYIDVGIMGLCAFLNISNYFGIKLTTVPTSGVPCRKNSLLQKCEFDS